ncbi:MAG: DUF192 domain-containing protein [Candidatus Paceibacterota bacterium]
MKNKKSVFLAVSIFLILLFCFFYYKKATLAPVNGFSIGGVYINIEKVDTEEKRMHGLSGRDSLPPDSGLFFVFEKPQLAGIWMKDMKFPIDIVWIDENFHVIYIKEDAKPESFPEIFIPPKEAMYVLEVNSGFVEKNKIKVGDRVVL